MASNYAEPTEEELLEALADGGLLARPPDRPATPEDTYAHHPACGISGSWFVQVILALIVTITFHVIWLTGEIPFIDPPVYCNNYTLEDQTWHVTSKIHMIQADNGISYVMYVKYLAMWHHICENSLGKIVTSNILRVHRLVLYSSDTFPPFSFERVLLEANTTDRVVSLMDDQLDQYVSEMPTLLGGPWSVYYDNCIYFFMDCPNSSAPPGLGALYIANLTSGSVQTLAAAGWNPAWVAKFGDAWINSTQEYMKWCHPFMFQTFPNNPVPYLLWGFNGGSGCYGTFSRWASNAGLAPLDFGTNTTWNFMIMGILQPAAVNNTIILTNFAALTTAGIPYNATLARALYEPTSSLPYYPPWDGNMTALYILPDGSAFLSAPSYWSNSKYSRCMWWQNGQMQKPYATDPWYQNLCDRYGGNIGRRGTNTGRTQWTFFDPDAATFFYVDRPASTLSSDQQPTASYLGSQQQAVLWPLQVRRTDEYGEKIYEERPCVEYLGVVTCWDQNS